MDEVSFGSSLEDLDDFAAQSFEAGTLGYHNSEVPTVQNSALNEDQIQVLRDHMIDGLLSKNWPDLEKAIQTLERYGRDATPLLQELEAVFEGSNNSPVQIAVMRALPKIGPERPGVIRFFEAQIVGNLEEKLREVAAVEISKTTATSSKALEVASSEQFESSALVRAAARGSMAKMEIRRQQQEEQAN
jgi:hypothetical protein